MRLDASQPEFKMPPGFWENQEFSNIFILAVAIALAKVVTKYLTKLRSTAATGYTRADHFDCLRLGVDFAFIGLVAGFGTLRALLRQSQDPSKTVSTLNSLLRSQSTFLAIETLLLLATILFATIFHDAAKTYYRGIFVPGIIGLLSISFALILFVSLIR
jgi:hypothetical protein